MAEHDDDIPQNLKHEQREDSEALRFHRTDPDGPRQPRDSLVTFAETKGLYATAAKPGASRPERGESDPRPVWDPDDVLARVPALIAALRHICPDGTILANDRKALAYGLVHSLHRQVVRLTGLTDSRQRALQRAIGADLRGDPRAEADLQAAIADYQNADARAKAFERIFSTAAIAYQREFGEAWAPTRSTYTLRGTPPGGRIVTPAQVRTADRSLKAQEARPSALAESSARYDVPERVLARSDAPDAEALYPQLRADWKALDDRARATGVHVSTVDGYSDIRRRARELTEHPDLPSLPDARLVAFLAGTDDPPAPERAVPETAEPAPSPAEPVGGSHSWDPERATRALRAIVNVIDQDMLADGTQLRDDLEPVLWSLVNCFDRHTDDLRRAIERLEDSPTPETDVLEAHIAELTGRLDAFDTLRDNIAFAYHDLTSKEWDPDSPATRATAGAPGRNPGRVGKEKRHQDIIVDPGEAKGPLVVVSGHKTYQDFDTIYRALNAQRARHPDMVLLHGGAPEGAVPIARTWARNYGVDQVLIKPIWPARDPDAPKPSREETRRMNNAAVDARNEKILALNPAAVLTFDAPGYDEKLAERARQLAIRVEAFIDPSLPPKRYRGQPGPAPAPEPEIAAAPPWEQPAPAVREYEAFVEDCQKHHAEARAAGVHPHYHRGAETIRRRATNLRGKDYLPDSDRAAIHSFCRRFETFAAARDRVQDLDRDLQKQTAETFARQVHVTPTADQDTPLLHRSESPEYPTWAEKTDKILPDAAAIAADPETYRVHLDHAADARDRIDQNTEILTAVRAADASSAPAEALLAGLRERSLAVAREAHADEISWIDHRGTPELLRHAELLQRREDLTPDMRDAVGHFRAQYDSAVEARQELHRLADDIDAQLDALSDLRVSAAERRLQTTEHPEYERWSGRVDELQQAASRMISETKRYGAHLRADPGLRSRIETTATVLVSTRDGCIRSAKMLPPMPSREPERAVKRAPAVEPTRILTPEPEPLPPSPPEPVRAPEPGISINP